MDTQDTSGAWIPRVQRSQRHLHSGSRDSGSRTCQLNGCGRGLGRSQHNSRRPRQQFCRQCFRLPAHRVWIRVVVESGRRRDGRIPCSSYAYYMNIMIQLNLRLLTCSPINESTRNLGQVASLQASRRTPSLSGSPQRGIALADSTSMTCYLSSGAGSESEAETRLRLADVDVRHRDALKLYRDMSLKM